jgi:hypothetical protein
MRRRGQGDSTPDPTGSAGEEDDFTRNMGLLSFRMLSCIIITPQKLVLPFIDTIDPSRVSIGCFPDLYQVVNPSATESACSTPAAD